MERLTEKHWRNLDPWECCGQDEFCRRDCHGPGGCTNGCIVPKLYARLAAYEDTGLEPEEVERLKEYMEPFTIRDMDRFREIMQAEKDGRLVVLPPNDPLTLDELREMDGEPVWVTPTPPYSQGGWYIVDIKRYLAVNPQGELAFACILRKPFAVYRRKPEVPS